jgi:hypothetical protein
MIKNQAGQAIGSQMVTAAGAAFTGAVTAYVTGDAGAETIGSVGAGLCTHKGNGYHTYLPSADETNYNLVAFTFIGAGAVPQTLQITTVPLSQIAALQSTSGLTSIAIPDLLIDAATEVRVARAGGRLEPGVAAWMLRKLNRLVDRWNATPGATWSTPFVSYTPTINFGPHTLGPAVGASWLLTEARPNVILGANVVLNTVTPNVRIPITIRDAVWFQNMPVQRLTSPIVTDLYYESSWPNGKVYLWPLPSTAYPIELRYDSSFTAYGPTDTLYLPNGYQDAVMLSLAEECAGGLGQTVSDDLRRLAGDARVIAFGATLPAPRPAKTRDAGMPGGGGRSSFNYRTGRSKHG